MPRSPIALIAATATAFLGAVDVASAQDTPPVPGCQGIQLVDKKRDNSQPSTDIVNLFYVTSGGKTTANLQVADLSTELPEGSTQWYWYVEYETPDGQSIRLTAYLKPDGSSGFKAREVVGVPDAGGVYVDVGPLNGRIFPGKDGIVQWELTEEIGATAANKLVNHFAAADEVVAGEPFHGTPYLRVVASIDDTTDVASKEYAVEECAAPEPPPAEETPQTPPPPPPPPPAQQPPPAEHGQTTERPTAGKKSKKKKARKCKAKAKKIKNKKKRARALKRCKRKAKRG